MSDYSKQCVALYAAATIIIVGVSWAVAWGYAASWRTVTENGYIQTNDSGRVLWTLPNKK